MAESALVSKPKEEDIQENSKTSTESETGQNSEMSENQHAEMLQRYLAQGGRRRRRAIGPSSQLGTENDDTENVQTRKRSNAVGPDDKPVFQTRKRSNAVGPEDKPVLQTRKRSNAVGPEDRPVLQTRKRSNAVLEVPEPVQTRSRRNAVAGQESLKLTRKYRGMMGFRETVKQQLPGFLDPSQAGALNANSSANVMAKKAESRKGRNFFGKMWVSGKEKTNKALDTGADLLDAAFSPIKKFDKLKDTTGGIVGDVMGVKDDSTQAYETYSEIKDAVQVKSSIEEAIAEMQKSGKTQSQDTTDVSVMSVFGAVKSGFGTIKEILSFFVGLTKSVVMSIYKKDIKYFKEWALEAAGIDIFVDKNATITEKIEAGFELLSGKIEWANDKLGIANAILAIVAKSSSAIPIIGAITSGLDAVVKGIDMGFQIWKVVKASRSRKTMKSKQALLKEKLANNLQSYIKKSGMDNEVDMKALTVRRKELEQKEDEKTITEKEQNELYDIRTYLFATHLDDINRKRINRSGLNIFYDSAEIVADAVAMAGSIATATGVGAAVGAGLSGGSAAVSGTVKGGKLLQKMIRTIKQEYHDIQGDEKSMDVKDAKRAEDARHFLQMVAKLPIFDPMKNDVVNSYANAEDYVDSMGCSHFVLYGKDNIKDITEYLIESMKSRE